MIPWSPTVPSCGKGGACVCVSCYRRCAATAAACTICPFSVPVLQSVIFQDIFRTFGLSLDTKVGPLEMALEKPEYHHHLVFWKSRLLWETAADARNTVWSLQFFQGNSIRFTNYIGFYVTVTCPFCGLGLKPDNLLLYVHEVFLIQNIGTIASDDSA